MIQQWTFRALDTLFFRDGMPYHAGEGGYSGVQSSFPPFITTLQGAIRTSLALERGWFPEADSPFPVELGDADGLGRIQLLGPYLRHCGESYYPLPLNVLMKFTQPRESTQPKKSNQLDDQTEFIRLIPGDEIECDLGTRRLPVPEKPAAGAKSGDGYWVTVRGMSTILAGNVPQPKDVKHKNVFWAEEVRVGIQRDNRRRATVEGMLYTCVHVRPVWGTELVVLVQGVPDDWTVKPKRVTGLGGEGRLAAVSVDQVNGTDQLLPAAPELNADGQKLRFTVTLITPGWFSTERDAPHNIQNVIRNGPPGVPGQCVSACVGKPEMVGGWDLARRRPKPLHPVLPAGSTWFYEADVSPNEVLGLHGSCLGERQSFGFGQILIGRWDNK